LHNEIIFTFYFYYEIKYINSKGLSRKKSGEKMEVIFEGDFYL